MRVRSSPAPLACVIAHAPAASLIVALRRSAAAASAYVHFPFGGVRIDSPSARSRERSARGYADVVRRELTARASSDRTLHRFPARTPSLWDPPRRIGARGDPGRSGAADDLGGDVAAIRPADRSRCLRAGRRRTGSIGAVADAERLPRPSSRSRGRRLRCAMLAEMLRKWRSDVRHAGQKIERLRGRREPRPPRSVRPTTERPSSARCTAGQACGRARHEDHAETPSRPRCVARPRVNYEDRTTRGR
jgi:hypothetical protein